VQHDDRPNSVLNELVILLGIANQLFEHSADMTPDAQVRLPPNRLAVAAADDNDAAAAAHNIQHIELLTAGLS
jgi:hypothetical protein